MFTCIICTLHKIFRFQSIRAVAVKVRDIVKDWAQTDCQKDPSLSLISSLYKDLQNDGFVMDSPKPKSAPISNDPNVVTSAEEEADLAKGLFFIWG